MKGSTLIVMALCAGASGTGAAAAAVDAPRAAELVRLVRQDCGSCHGMTLKGGLGPPLLPADLRDKPLDALRYTVAFGRPGTAMPGWNSILSDIEIDWIVRRLREGFPEDRQADPVSQRNAK